MTDIRMLGVETWSDFVSLMSADSQCSECWCLNHRERAHCPTGTEAQARMKTLTTQSKLHGLLAYDGESCIGWLAIDPMSELIGHDFYDSRKNNEWAIHCLFVKNGYRGRGISHQLIVKAIDYAKTKKAAIISAFPIPVVNRSRFPAHEAEFSGRFSTFLKLGFHPVGPKTDFYERMEFILK